MAAPASGVGSDVKKDGRFMRKESSFRNWIRRDGSTDFKPDQENYHLYVSLACPWAHRTLITKELLGLDKISTTVVHYHMDDKGWRFVTKDEVEKGDAPEYCTPDPLHGFERLSKLYFEANSHYEGRYTVPVLWDKKKNTIVNNESSEIIKMLATEFDAKSKNPKVDLYPKDMREKIDKVADSFYNNVNNGVYRCGFATSQDAYNEAFGELFQMLDKLDEDLGKSRYLCGDKITLADIRLFTTVCRFDAVYVTHFKTNKKRIYDYPNLREYLKDLYQMPEFKKTTDLFHIKHHYFTSHPWINPTRIVPNGPEMSYLSEPHDRDTKFK